MKDDNLYVIHMRESIARIQAYTEDGRKAFFASSLIQDAVCRNLQTLGESSKRLTQSLKNTGLEINWKAIAAFRNVLVHDYLGVDLNVVWNIVERDLPALAAFLDGASKKLRLPKGRVSIKTRDKRKRNLK